MNYGKRYTHTYTHTHHTHTHTLTHTHLFLLLQDTLTTRRPNNSWGCGTRWKVTCSRLSLSGLMQRLSWPAL